MKNKLTLLITILFFALYQQNGFAQCDINSFSATPIPGICMQDGSISILVSGAVNCSETTAVTATIRPTGATSDTEFIILSATGTGTFSNLAPGSYEVRLSQGTTTSTPSTVILTSSYTQISLTATPTNCSCSSGDTLYSNNGILNTAVTGGTGPFLYEVMQGLTVVQTFGPSTDVSHQFTGLAPGNYSLRLTDLSTTCSNQVTRTFAIQQTVYNPKLGIYTLRPLRVSTTGICGMSRLSFELQYGNLNALNIPGNVTATYGGNTYNLTGPTTGTLRAFVLNNVPDNTTVVFNATDGCNSVSSTYTTKAIDPNFIDMVNMNQVLNNCIPSVRFGYNGAKSGAGFQWKSNVVLAMYKEVPADSNNWVFVQNATNTGILHSGGNTTYLYSDDLTTRYKFIATDDCHSAEEIMDPRGLTSSVNPLSLTTLQETTSILEGTSAIKFTKNGGLWSPTSDNLSYPINIQVTRTDGSSNMTILPTKPYNLSGSYNITFPINHQWVNSNSFMGNGDGPVIGDLPLGEYQVTLTDACGISYTRVINLTQQVSYSPNITLVSGCATTDIQYNMGATHVANYSKVKLYTNNGSGEPGTLVRDETENGSFQLSGQFSTVPPGNYVISYTAINYSPTTLPFKIPNSSNQFSAARNLGIQNLTYYTPITIQPYQQVKLSTTSLFCDNADANSGILSITISGIPKGFITYSVWNSTANPDSDTPLYTYNTSDLNEINHIFQNLSAGNYKVRVYTACGFTEKAITLTPGVIAYPSPIASPQTVCAHNSATTLSIALPESLFDIVWKDATGTILGTGANLAVTPIATTTYTVEIIYKLCDASTFIQTDETTVIVKVSKIWDGSENADWNNANNWTPVGVPTADECIVISNVANDPIVSGASYDALGLNLTIQNGAVLTVNATNDIIINDWVNINAGGDLQLNNSASLIQINNNPNTGTMHMNRTVNIRRLDYVYWSSPVTSFASNAISLGTSTGYIYKWIPTIGANINGFGNWALGNENMVVGKGYIVRGPDAFTTTPAPFTATFTGTPNNGIITTPILRGTWNGGTYSTGVSTTLGTNYDDNWNLIGNPYPSAVNAISFLTANTNIDGFIKIWTHGTLPSTAIADPFYSDYVYNYTPGDYITYNSSGTSSGPGVFNGNIASGQGFFVSMLHTSGSTSENVTFNNSMRNTLNNNSQFFRNSSEINNANDGRIWLDLIDANANVVRNLVGYIDGATNSRDRLFDAITDEKLNFNLYSKIGDEPMTIQGRTLPFDVYDLVPMGIKVPQNGNYSIGIGAVDGFFTNTSQNIYLEDLDTNIIHDLRQNPYSFTAVAGDDSDRFILRFTNSTLGNEDVLNEETNVWAITADYLSIKSTKNTIQSVRVFDILGRLLADYQNVNGYEVPLTKIQKNNVALIIQVTLSNGTIVNKKVLY